MKKLKNMNTNVLILVCFVFLTIFLSTGGALANSLAHKNFTFFLVGLLGWGTQFIITSLITSIGIAIVKLCMLLSNLKEKNQKNQSSKKRKEDVE